MYFLSVQKMSSIDVILFAKIICLSRFLRLLDLGFIIGIAKSVDKHLKNCHLVKKTELINIFLSKLFGRSSSSFETYKVQ